MLQKIKSNFLSLSVPSAKLMMYGIQFCCMLILISGIVYLRNDFSGNYSHTVNELCKLTVATSASVFAEIVIGGLAMDIYEKRHRAE